VSKLSRRAQGFREHGELESIPSSRAPLINQDHVNV